MSDNGNEWMLVCPVCSQASHERDPVVAEDGATYCRQCIEAWHHSLRERGELVISAVTREPMGESMHGSSVAPDESAPKNSDRTVQNIASLNDVFSQLDSVRDILSSSLGGWQPPEVVMVGEESSGKSSVLERLAMMPIFPRGDKLTTRLPIVVHLRNVETASPPRLEVVDKTTGKTVVGPYVVPSVSGHIDVSNAMDSILREEQRNLPQHKICMTRKIVLHIENPMVPSIDLVDLPGLVRTGQASEDTKKLVEEHIAKNDQHSIYLLTCPASIAPNTSLSAGLVLEKQLESRTVGIFTMCDEAVSSRLKARLEERLNPEATDEDGAVPLSPHGWVAAMNAHIDNSDNFQRLRDQAAAEEEWMEANMPASLKERCGSGALIERVSELFHKYLSKSWVPRTISKIKQELKTARLQDAVLGLPKLQGEPEEARRLALVEATRLLDSESWKAARMKRFSQEILQPLKQAVVSALGHRVSTANCKTMPLDVFPRWWAEQRDAVESACRAAADRWPELVAQDVMEEMQKRQPVPEDAAAIDALIKAPPFVLARFPAFIQVVGAAMLAEMQVHAEAAMEHAQKLASAFFTGIMHFDGMDTSTTDLKASPPTISLYVSGQALAEKVVFAFVCAGGAYTEPVVPLLERAAGVPSNVEWEEACAAERNQLARRVSDLESALTGVRSFGFSQGPQVSSAASSMAEHLADEGMQVRGCEKICALFPTTKEWLAYQSKDREEMLQAYEACGDCGTVTALLSAMQAHPASPVVQSLASEALAKLSRANTIADRIAAQGGIEAVLSAMRMHSKLEEEGDRNQAEAVQTNGSWLLANLATKKSSDYRSKIASLGGIELLLNAMRQHPRSEQVQQRQLLALNNLLSDGNKDNAAKAASLGADELVNAAIQNHSTSSGDNSVKYWGNEVLQRLRV